MVVRHERNQTVQIVTTPPVSEILGSTEESVNVWPEIASNNPEFLTQISRHEATSEAILSVLDISVDPTIRIEELVEDGLISNTQAINFYDSLSALLSNPETSRILLYLPFEYIPDLSLDIDNEELESSISNFTTEYLAAWIDLLNSHDPEANFIDGDVLEEDHRDGDLPRVVKVVQFVPMLISLGYITASELTELYDSADNPLLRRNLGEIIDSLSRESTLDDFDLSDNQPVDIQDIKAQIDSVVVDIETDIPDAVTLNRLTWLRQERRNQVILSIAHNLCPNLAELDNLDTLVDDILGCSDQDLAVAVLVESIKADIEDTYFNGGDTRSAFDRYDAVLEKLSLDACPETIARFNILLRHAYHMGILADTDLISKGVMPSNLSGALSQNLENIKIVTQKIEHIVQDIMHDPELNLLVFPVVTIGGSQLKGYGEEGSDLDFCVFIRPDVPESSMEIVRTRLTELFVDTWQQDQPIELWLSGDNYLHIDPPNKFDMYMANRYWTHILFNTAWVGSKGDIELIQNKLLMPYFADSDIDFNMARDRLFYLERIEQDLLQYRLMHKGYNRHFPPVNGHYQPNKDQVGSDSVFWDPGYRRLATKLFAEKVFLPRIK